MSQQFTTPLSSLLAAAVRCVRTYAGPSLPALPPWVHPEQSAAQFALDHPQEAEAMINELYVLLHSHVARRHPS